MLAERLETEIKYAGYIARQDRMIREVARHEKTLIPEDFEYAALTGLTLEAREKLARIRPQSGAGGAHPRRFALRCGAAEHRTGREITKIIRSCDKINDCATPTT